jgi:hypothetical protein
MSSEPTTVSSVAGTGVTVAALNAHVRADLNRFIAVTRSTPVRVLYEPYRGVWCPPLEATLRATLAPENPIYEHTEWKLFVASRGAVDVGRVAAFWNPLSTLVVNDNLGFFGFFEAADVETARALLFDAVWPWLKQRGAGGMVGNISPTTNDEVGVLVEGYHRHIFLLSFNPPEYPRFFDALGFGKEHDVLSFVTPFRAEVFRPVVGRRTSPDDIGTFADAMARRAGVTIETLDKRHPDKFAREFCSLYNKAWRDHWGFEPYTSAEMLYTAKDLLGLIPKEMVLSTRNKDGEMVGGAVCMPDLNDLFREFDGKMGVREMAKTAAAIFAPASFSFVKRSKTLRFIALGVLPGHKSRGASAALMLKIVAYGLQHGYELFNQSWVLEDNAPMLSVMQQSMHLEIDQRWRFYSWRPS